MATPIRSARTTSGTGRQDPSATNGGARAKREQRLFLLQSSAATELAANERLRCSDGEDRFSTIEPRYGDGGVRRFRANSDTCRNRTATAPPRDKAINSISTSIRLTESYESDRGWALPPTTGATVPM
jgi:hypothetical protein